MMPTMFRRAGFRHGGLYLTILNGRVTWGLRHRPLTKIARLAFLSSLYPKKGRALC